MPSVTKSSSGLLKKALNTREAWERPQGTPTHAGAQFAYVEGQGQKRFMISGDKPEGPCINVPLAQFPPCLPLGWEWQLKAQTAGLSPR